MALIPQDQETQVLQAAETVADALWAFLDGVYDTYCQDIMEGLGD
jgi:pyrroloquinoline quinone (PQQ) biosynthesis protein C